MIAKPHILVPKSRIGGGHFRQEKHGHLFIYSASSSFQRPLFDYLVYEKFSWSWIEVEKYYNKPEEWLIHLVLGKNLSYFGALF